MPLTKAEMTKIAEQMAAIVIEKGATPSKSAKPASSATSGKSATSKATAAKPAASTKSGSPSRSSDDDDTPISRGKADPTMTKTRLENAAKARRIPHSNKTRQQLADDINTLDGYKVTDLQEKARKSGEKVSGTREELLARLKLIKA